MKLISLVLTLVFGRPVLRQAAGAREELEADVALEQRLQLLGLTGEHVGVVGSVVVPEARHLLWETRWTTVSHLRPATTSTDTSPARLNLVGLVAQVAAERFPSCVRWRVLVQQGGAGEHLVADGTRVEILLVDVLHVLTMLLLRREAQAAALAVMGLGHV